MLIFETKDPSKCGIVELDQNDVVKNFHEKTNKPPGNLANGAVYVFDYSLIDKHHNVLQYRYNSLANGADIGSCLKLANELSANANY